MKKILAVILAALCLGVAGCGPIQQSADTQQAQQTEQLAQEATSSVGMPNIRNFRERRLLKDIYELRDQDGLATYTYLFAEATGKLVFFCHSIGYPIPYSTQYTNPEYIARYSSAYGIVTLPQPEPTGNFSAASAEGTWVMCIDPVSNRARVTYVEPRVVANSFPLTADTPVAQTSEQQASK